MKSKILVFMIALLLVFSVIMVAVGGESSDVNFSEENETIEIHDWYDLDAVREDLEADYILRDDLDEDTEGYDELVDIENGWNPIGGQFSGDFDGNGYDIKDLYIDRDNETNVGLFAGSFLGEIQNLDMIDIYVRGGSSVGGIVGYNRGTINNSYMTGKINGESNVVGGLTGTNGGIDTPGHIHDSFSKANVSGEDSIGGLTGSNIMGGSVTNSFATGDVDGEQCVGGITSSNDGKVSNSYATGNISGDMQIGGLIGRNYVGTVSNSYSIGEVSGNSEVGGLVGNNTGTVEDSFWDIETSGIEESNGGTGKTTKEMKNVATYTDNSTEGLDKPWDFVADPYDDERHEDIWDINQDGAINYGYPFLAWEKKQGEHELTLHIEGQGSIKIKDREIGDGWASTFEEGETVELTALPGEGCYLHEWDGIDKTSENITIEMDEDKEITAQFEEKLELELEIEGNGSVEIDGEEVENRWSGTYEKGEKVDLQAVPTDGWIFEEWGGNVLEDKEESNITITMDENKTITAHFEEKEKQVPFSLIFLLTAVVISAWIYKNKKF